jgi:hypothetical protein
MARVLVEGSTAYCGRSPTEHLQHNKRNEKWVVDQITLAEASRLCQQAKEPLQTDPHHPSGSLSLNAGMKIECGAYAHQHRCIQQVYVLTHPLLLLRGADSDPYYIRTRLIDLIYYRSIFLDGQRAEWRRMNTYDKQARKTGDQPINEPFCYARGTSIEEMAIAMYQRALANPKQEIRSVNALHIAKSHQTAQPDQWHPIRRNKTGGIVDRSHDFTPITLNNAVHSG